jgi:TPR repeat protein
VLELFDRACGGKVGAACYEVGVAWEAARNPAKALSFYQRGCSGGDANSCAKVRKLQP